MGRGLGRSPPRLPCSAARACLSTPRSSRARTAGTSGPPVYPAPALASGLAGHGGLPLCGPRMGCKGCSGGPPGEQSRSKSSRSCDSEARSGGCGPYAIKSSRSPLSAGRSGGFRCPPPAGAGDAWTRGTGQGGPPPSPLPSPTGRRRSRRRRKDQEMRGGPRARQLPRRSGGKRALCGRHPLPGAGQPASRCVYGRVSRSRCRLDVGYKPPALRALGARRPHRTH
jgi:hypothetical protein